MEHRNVPFSLEIFELVFPWIEAKSYFVRFQAPDLRFRWVSEREPCQHNIPRGVSVFEIIGAVGVVHVEEVGGHRTPRFRAVCLGLFAGWGPPLHGALGLKLLQCAPVAHRLKRNPYFFCLKLISFRLARAVWQRGGWDAMKAAWSRPPASTEQVLHPEKYFAGEAPQRVDIAYQPPGGKLLNEGVLGEMLVRTLLGEGSDAAAAGWGGDRFRVWDVGGKSLLAWRSAWDSPADLQEFRQALSARLGWSGKPPITLEEAGSVVGISRERMRQLQKRTLDRLPQHPVFMPLLDAGQRGSGKVDGKKRFERRIAIQQRRELRP